jgi:hypothetical protein
VGALGSVLTSSDAVTWTPQSSGTTELLDGITYVDVGGGSIGFIAVGYGNPATILRSENGITWMPLSSGTNLPLLDVAWNGGELVAVGLLGVVLRSADVFNWTRDDWATESTLHDVDFVNGQFVVVGDWGALVRQECGSLEDES